MIDGLAPLHPLLAQRYKEILLAKNAMRQAALEVQDDCPHLQVLHVEYSGSDYGRGLPPRRICAGCRLEEEGSHWSSKTHWRSANEAGPAKLGNERARLVVETTRDEFYRLRLPYTPI